MNVTPNKKWQLPYVGPTFQFISYMHLPKTIYQIDLISM